MIIAVEFDVYDAAVREVRTLRLSTERLLYRGVQYEPRLLAPFVLGSRITAENYGQPVRVAPNGGTIAFALDEKIWPWLDYHWQGRPFRVFAGSGPSDLRLVSLGRIAGLTHDTLNLSVQTTDASLDLDKPLITDLYPTALPTPQSLQGRPRPQLWGSAISIAPVLEDEATQTYRVSRAPLDDITEIRVGGIPWERTEGDPGAGQWSPNLPAGTFRLGSVTLGAEVRCDARSFDGVNLTTAALLTSIVEGGLEVDPISLAAFDGISREPIGFYVTDPINRLDALDEIIGGVGGWWGIGLDGRVIAGLIAAVPEGPALNASKLDIQSLRLSAEIPPAWRVRVEHSRNWSPQTNFEPAVPDVEQQKWRAAGVIAPAFEDLAIRTVEPRAIDAPLIRSLVQSERAAVAIRDRLRSAWSVRRRLYDAVSFIEPDAVPLYAGIDIDYQMVKGRFRVLSAVRSFGGRATQLQLWG